MQNVVFAGRLAADPEAARYGEDKARATFRLIENRGTDAQGRERTVGVNCVAWGAGLVDKVIMPGLKKGCEVIVVGAFVDTAWEARDGGKRFAKELVVDRITVLDWADRVDAPAAADSNRADRIAA